MIPCKYALIGQGGGTARLNIVKHVGLGAYTSNRQDRTALVQALKSTAIT